MNDVGAALIAATHQLSTVSDTPRLDAELLMAHAFGITRETMLLSRLGDIAPLAFKTQLARRLLHEPVAYIIGTRDFWTITLNVGPGVLIPRPDSETLIEAAVGHFGADGPKRVLDLGTGSGALLLAALAHWPSATGVGVDASDTALAIASDNARRLGLADRARFANGDWGQGIAERFDLILCNPPYVETGAALAREVVDYEPHEALYAGDGGLNDYRRLMGQLPSLMGDAGIIVLEIGATQAAAVTAIAKRHGLAAQCFDDLARRNRCLLLARLGQL